MANKTFQGRIVQKHDTKANWDKATNFVPLKGEIIVYDDLKKIKIGDGATKIGSLAFINDLDTLAAIAKTGNYNDLKNKPTIPTKLSNLTDDVVSGKYLSLTGGTMTANGKITMDSAYTPSANGDVATKQYVDNHVPVIDPPVGTSTNYAIYIGSTAPASGTTPLLWIDTTASTGTFKYRTSTTGTWKPVPVAWS